MSRQLQSGSLEKDWGITVGKRGWYVWVILLTASVVGRRIKMRGASLPCCFKVEEGEWRSGPMGRRRMGLDKTQRRIWGGDTTAFPTHSLLLVFVQQLSSPTLRHAARRLTVQSLPSSVWSSKSRKHLAAPVSWNCSKPVRSAPWTLGSSKDSYP